MDQEKFFNQIKEEILNRLPMEAVQALAEIEDVEENQAQIAKILDDNNINVDKIAQDVAARGGQNG